MAKQGARAVARVAARRYWRESDGRVVVEAWHRSGRSMAEFARKHEIQPKRLRRWVRRIAEAEPKPEPGSLTFHRVRLVEPERGGVVGSGVEIVLAGSGHTIRVAPGFSADDLGRVVAVLEDRR